MFAKRCFLLVLFVLWGMLASCGSAHAFDPKFPGRSDIGLTLPELIAALERSVEEGEPRDSAGRRILAEGEPEVSEYFPGLLICDWDLVPLLYEKELYDGVPVPDSAVGLQVVLHEESKKVRSILLICFTNSHPPEETFKRFTERFDFFAHALMQVLAKNDAEYRAAGAAFATFMNDSRKQANWIEHKKNVNLGDVKIAMTANMSVGYDAMLYIEPSEPANFGKTPEAFIRQIHAFAPHFPPEEPLGKVEIGKVEYGKKHEGFSTFLFRIAHEVEVAGKVNGRFHEMESLHVTWTTQLQELSAAERVTLRRCFLLALYGSQKMFIGEWNRNELIVVMQKTLTFFGAMKNAESGKSTDFVDLSHVTVSFYGEWSDEEIFWSVGMWPRR